MKCPDCGGIIGGQRGGEEGRPCVCFGRRVITIGSKPTKLCCVCGKDVSQKKRLKDSRGYWCMDCHHADQVRHARKATRRTASCQECGREVGIDSLTQFDGLRLCRRCVSDRRALPQYKRFRPVRSSAYERHEKRRLLILFGILLVLAIFMVLGWMTRGA